MILDITPEQIEKELNNKRTGDRKFLVKYASWRLLVDDMMQTLETRTDYKKLCYVFSIINSDSTYLSRNWLNTTLTLSTANDTYHGIRKEDFNKHAGMLLRSAGGWTEPMQYDKCDFPDNEFVYTEQSYQLDTITSMYQHMFPYAIFDTDGFWSTFAHSKDELEKQNIDRKLIPIFDEYNISKEEIEVEYMILKNIYQSIFNSHYGRSLLNNITM